MACRSNGSSRSKYRAKNQSKDDVPIDQFRRECREFAAHWIEVQKRDFKRLGVVGDWDNPYTTMAYSAEAQIVRELGKFLVNGGLYKGAKPVLWSVVEQTALAEAEVEYHDHRSTTVWVRFPIQRVRPVGARRCGGGDLDDNALDIAGNRAIAFSPGLDYVVLRVDRAAEGSRARTGESLLVAEPLVEAARGKQPGSKRIRSSIAFPAPALAGTVAAHPLRGQGYDFDVPLLPAGFVEADQGTGLVHIAPGHGADDFELGQMNGLPVPDTVSPDGFYLPVGAALCRALDLPPRRQAGRRERSGDRCDRWRRRAVGARHARAFLPAFLAVQGAADLSQYAAVVHRLRGERPAAERAGGHRRDPLDPTAGQNRIEAMVESRPGLVRLAPARLGRADRGVHAP